MQIGCISDFVYQKGYRLDDGLSALLGQSAFNCVNLEAPLVGENDIPVSKGINLHQLDDFTEFFHQHKITVVSLANNHIFDYGVSAFERSTSLLRHNGISYFGAGLDLATATAPLVLHEHGKRIAFWGFAWHFTEAQRARSAGPGVAPLEAHVVRRALKCDVDADYRVVYVHFGIEYEDYPDPYQKYIAELIINEGLADVVIGTHPHCVQGICAGVRRERNWAVFYSLGHFILPQSTYSGRRLSFPRKSQYGYLVTLHLDSRLTFTVHPYRIDEANLCIRLVQGAEHDRLMNSLSGLGKPLGMKQWRYTLYFAIHRARWHFPIISRYEWLNDIQIRAFRAMESTAIRLLKLLHVHSYVKRLLGRSIVA